MPEQDRKETCYRPFRRLAASTRTEIDRRYPKILRRVGGYNLDRIRRGQAEFNLAHLFVGSEGTLGVVVEAKLRLVELPQAKAVLVVQFADLLDALAATPLDPGPRPGRRRGDGSLHPRQHPAQPRGVPAARLLRTAIRRRS